MTIQYQLSNGQWMNCESRTETFVNRAAEYNKTDAADIRERLEAGRVVRFGSDWSSEIRKQPQPRQPSPFPQSREFNGLGNAIDSDDY